MKKIFTILALCLPLFAMTQILLDPAEDIYQEYPINEWTGDYIHIKNVSGAPMTINFETLSNTFLSDWTSNFCAGSNCYNYIPLSGSVGLVNDGEESYLNCSMGFWEYIGEGTVTFRIYDANDPAVADTISITYKVVEEITGTNDLANDYNFKLSPNPTTSDLNVINDQLEDYEVNVYSLTGQLVLNEKVFGKSWNGDLSNQPNGIYILTIVSKDGLVFREKISKI